jgi:hypothetical protein
MNNPDQSIVMNKKVFPLSFFYSRLDVIDAIVSP